MKILVINSGSSSVKACVYEIGWTLPENPPPALWEAKIEWQDKTDANCGEEFPWRRSQEPKFMPRTSGARRT